VNIAEILRDNPLVQIIIDGGLLVMVPLLALSMLSLATIVERLWFWVRILTKEQEIVNRVLEAARYDWGVANEIARQAYRQPIGRFLYAPLRLNKPEPEVFRLALEAAADEELASMRRGDKVLEAVIALAPLLGLLGTVLGLIDSLGSLTIQAIVEGKTEGVTAGIGKALYTTATGMIVAIISMAFYRMFQGFLFNQVKVFRRAGNELELLYRQFWPQSENNHHVVDSSGGARVKEAIAEPLSKAQNSVKNSSSPPNYIDSSETSKSEDLS